VTVFVWILLGACIGTGAALILRVEGRWARLLNVGAGIIGSVGGGFAEGRGGIRADPWDLNGLIVAAAGATILIGIANLFRHRPVH
jgi:uncharacterized membrane protein YeaQ/YmgE (transglycosylase-associated protein family)